jgi:CheY-like chemotaxis protein
MDGIEAAARIRALEDLHKDLPIVALTANAVSGTKEMFLENGFDDFLSKPIDTIRLNFVLERWIPKDKQKRQAEEIADAARGYDSGGLPEISGVDVGDGIAMTGGTVERYLQTLAVFCKDGWQKAKELKSCLETDDMPLFTTYVHALKSASASIGASGLSKAAAALEKAGRRGDVSYIHANATTFLPYLETLLGNIGAVLPKAGECVEKPVDPTRLKEELSRLKTALDAFDSSEIDGAVEALRCFSRAADVGAAVGAILQNTLIGEYDEAVSLIDEVLAGC